MKSIFYKFRVDTIAKIFIVCILIMLGVKILYQSQYSNGLFSWSLRNSELMTVNAGKGFAEQGFLSNGGLQDLHYGMLSNDGKKKHYIKLTYPPAPHWLAGIYIKICGIGKEACYRLFPAIFSIISLIFVAKILLSVLDPIKSALMMLSLAVIPATTTMMHGLAYVTYSSTLFLVQLAFLLKFFKGNPKENKIFLFMLFIAGFIQGWFSLDYIFLVCLSAIPFALLYFQDTKEYRNRFLFAILACSIGFLFAQFLHLIQVVIYKGSILEAYKPLYKMFLYRLEGALTLEELPYGSEYSRLSILLDYLRNQAGSGNYFRINVTKILLITVSLMLIQKANVTIQKPLQISLNWKSTFRNSFVILTAFIVSILWIVIMKQQSTIHQDFFTMHLFLLYFICLLTVLECVDFGNDNTKLQKQ